MKTSRYLLRFFWQVRFQLVPRSSKESSWKNWRSTSQTKVRCAASVASQDVRRSCISVLNGNGLHPSLALALIGLGDSDGDLSYKSLRVGREEMEGRRFSILASAVYGDSLSRGEVASESAKGLICLTGVSGGLS